MRMMHSHVGCFPDFLRNGRLGGLRRSEYSVGLPPATWPAATDRAEQAGRLRSLVLNEVQGDQLLLNEVDRLRPAKRVSVVSICDLSLVTSF